MMVPRVFAATSPPRLSPLRTYDEKKNISVRTRPVPSPPKTRSPSPSKTSSRSPISTSSTGEALDVPDKRSTPQVQAAEVSPQRPQHTTLQAPPKRESVQDILSATAIPIRRKPKRRVAQRLPEGDHVANFSTLIQDDLRLVGASPSSSYSAQFDGLFGSIGGHVDGPMYVGSEGLDASILRSRSLSAESMPSLASPDELSIGANSNASPLSSRSPSYRKIRHVVSSEDCALEHPLLPEEDEEESVTPDLILTPIPRKARAEGSRRASTFKSTLTASLRAIKSAAQSVSNYATPFSEADMFSTPFDLRPGLTDDRRPPPDAGPPSPALRRYLNPNISAPADSPVQLHWVSDHRSLYPPSPPSHSPRQRLFPEDGFRPRPKKRTIKDANSTEPTRLPNIVPLATCVPSAVRTAHASSPPIWLAPDGTPTNKQTATPLFNGNGGVGTGGPLKQREPRENRDFLRIFVAELGMKKAGKLRQAAEGHARMWLPPVAEERGKAMKTTGRDRWGVWIWDDDRGEVVRVS